MRRIFWMMCTLLLSVSVVLAQGDCPSIAEQALEAADSLCSDLERNQACYGNVLLSAEPQIGVTNFEFEQAGDIADLENIQSIELSGMDTTAGTWGVAILSVQADLPDTLPGQNVTFVLFGDVTLENAAEEGQNPMQAFYLRTGIGDSACEEAPESGLLVQTPDGVDSVAFTANGVDVEIGSTVFFQAEAEDNMNVSTVEGTAILDFDGESYPIIAGTWLQVPMGAQLLPTGRPELPEAYNTQRFAPLPIGVLPRPIDLAPPLDDTQLGELRNRLDQGLPPCDAPGLPACEDLPILGVRDRTWAPTTQWGLQWQPGVNCALPGAESSDLPICPPAFELCEGSRLLQDRAVCGGEEPSRTRDDIDGDGFPNDEDFCPARPGPIDGCPLEGEDRTEGDTILSTPTVFVPPTRRPIIIQPTVTPPDVRPTLIPTVERPTQEQPPQRPTEEQPPEQRPTEEQPPQRPTEDTQKRD